MFLHQTLAISLQSSKQHLMVQVIGPRPTHKIMWCLTDSRIQEASGLTLGE